MDYEAWAGESIEAAAKAAHTAYWRKRMAQDAELVPASWAQLDADRKHAWREAVKAAWESFTESSAERHELQRAAQGDA